MNSINTLKPALQTFLEQIPFEAIASDVAFKTGKPASEILALLNTYANESQVSLELVADHLAKADCILEVGAGLCLLSLFLKQQDYPITALEPAIGGYGIFEQTRDAILDHFSTLQLDLLTIPAQQLSENEHGNFDLIFSNNVMEHIPEWSVAIAAMANVLTSDGKMRHACPNYTVPYEPHYGTPVFRHFRNLSERLFLNRDADLEIWHSLNFITCGQIRCFCRNQDLICAFDKGLLYKAFQRIHDDPVFQKRHQGLISFIANLVVKSPFRQLVSSIPASLSTPMIFEIHRAGIK
ncbi:class I SAM-dependent methyltransferase [Mariprofundus sp. NF]|uniref:class I SAM-dependent methyltransferase n=1 Tax=Mariprofundus sp. NF TaxID=2608716 RepID=UPI0015A1EBA6|nr:methyltransferase domain-containing protein [Mariprofundus sp. NF]NWF39430.1 class I SAM-dependent methyltransferase [Mariprofundus sp. NF]